MGHWHATVLVLQSCKLSAMSDSMTHCTSYSTVRPVRWAGTGTVGNTGSAGLRVPRLLSLSAVRVTVVRRYRYYRYLVRRPQSS